MYKLIRRATAALIAVAVQGLIVYGQAQEAYQAVLASVSDPSANNSTPDELRALASNLLVASHSLFDDLDARDFLLQVNQLMASMFTAANGRVMRSDSLDHTEHLANRMNQVQSSFQPLVSQFSPDYRRRMVDADPGTNSDPGSGADSDPASDGASGSDGDPGLA